MRPIVPLVFYQGRQPWASSTEFSDLFAAAVREWPWLPHFEHLLIDLSAATPETVEAVRGEPGASLKNPLEMKSMPQPSIHSKQVAVKGVGVRGRG